GSVSRFERRKSIVDTRGTVGYFSTLAPGNAIGGAADIHLLRSPSHVACVIGDDKFVRGVERQSRRWSEKSKIAAWRPAAGRHFFRCIYAGGRPTGAAVGGTQNIDVGIAGIVLAEISSRKIDRSVGGHRASAMKPVARV